MLVYIYAGLVGFFFGVGLVYVCVEQKLKRLKEYEINIIPSKNNRIENLESEIGDDHMIIRELSKIRDSTPPDCKEGSWCTGCQFVKHYHKYLPYGYGIVDVPYCGKAEVCKNFVQKN